MRFPDPLLPGRLVRRYKRFFADVELTEGAKAGDVVTAHCPNPGSMLGLKDPGLPAWLSPARNPDRKLRYTLELVEADGAMVGINTGWPGSFSPSMEPGLGQWAVTTSPAIGPSVSSTSAKKRL